MRNDPLSIWSDWLCTNDNSAPAELCWKARWENTTVLFSFLYLLNGELIKLIHRSIKKKEKKSATSVHGLYFKYLKIDLKSDRKNPSIYEIR